MGDYYYRSYGEYDSSFRIKEQMTKPEKEDDFLLQFKSLDAFAKFVEVITGKEIKIKDEVNRLNTSTSDLDDAVNELSKSE